MFGRCTVFVAFIGRWMRLTRVRHHVLQGLFSGRRETFLALHRSAASSAADIDGALILPATRSKRIR
jgi:hypothetical protein